MSRDFSTRGPARGAGRSDQLLLVAGLVAVLGVALLERRARALEAGRGGADARAAGRLRLTAAAPPGRVLAALAAPMPPGVRLGALSLAYDEGLTIEAQVEALAAEDYDRYVERLDASAVLTDLRPGSELRDGSVSGGLTARWREP